MMITTGRTLDEAGVPVEGTGFEYPAGGRLAELLAKRIGPVFSNITTGEWGFGLEDGASSGGKRTLGVGIFRPGNLGPPEHFHPSYVESFEVIQGVFEFVVDGKAQRLGAGEKISVPVGAKHVFPCVSEEFGALSVEVTPPGRVGEVITTLYGLSHEGGLNERGQPRFWQAMAFGAQMAGDTVFTSPPPAIAVPVAKSLAPVARALGYRASYPQYLDPAYWEAKIEQPPGGNYPRALEPKTEHSKAS